jgi:hypothetical protein
LFTNPNRGKLRSSRQQNGTGTGNAMSSSLTRSQAGSRIWPALLVLSVLVLEGALGGRALGAVVQQALMAQPEVSDYLPR